MTLKDNGQRGPEADSLSLPSQAGPGGHPRGQGDLSLSALRGWELAALCASKEEPGLKVLPEAHSGAWYQDWVL